MSIAVGLDELRAKIEEFATDAYLLTVSDDGRAHSVAVPVRWDGDAARRRQAVRPPSRTRRPRPLVALLWPPPERGGFSLIVDADVTRVDDGRGRRLAADARGAAPPRAVGRRERLRAGALGQPVRGSTPTSSQKRRHDSNASGSWLVVSASWSAPTPAPCAGRSSASTMYQRRNLRRSKHHSRPSGAVDPHVGVPVLQHALVPPAVGTAELVVAVHDAARVVGVVEVDDVVADEVHRHLRARSTSSRTRRAARRDRAPRVRRARRG